MPYPAEIVATTTALPHGTGSSLTKGGHCIDYTQNGVWWACLLDDTNDILKFYFSTDDGETWTHDSSMNIVGVSSGDGIGGFDGYSIFIDESDFMHVVAAGNNQATAQHETWYYRGTPNAGRTSYTLAHDTTSGEQSHGNWGGTMPLDIIAFADPTSGWHVWYSNTFHDGGTFLTYLCHIILDSNGAITSNANIQADTSGFPQQTESALDFRHTAANPKVVQSATPSIYHAYHVASNTDLTHFRKWTYSAGNWSQGAERTIDSSADQRATFGCVYDGTRVIIASERIGSSGTMRVWERDEADTTTTDRTPAAIPNGGSPIAGGGIATDEDGNIFALAIDTFSDDLYRNRYDRAGAAWDGWTVMRTGTLVTGSQDEFSMPRARGSLDVFPCVYADAATSEVLFDVVVASWPLSGTLQGVASITSATMQAVRGLSGTLQGIARWAKARLTKTPQGAPGNFVEPEIDFTVYDGYLEGGDGVVHSLIYHEDGETKGTTAALPTRADKQDVGQNPLEQRPEFGDFFAQGDFSNGADQLYFHHEGRDPKKFLASEGYDITEEGSLTHLHRVAEAVDSTTIGAVTQANGVILVADGTDVKVGNGAFPGVWTPEDPSGASEAAATVLDLTSRGDEVFAALGAAGVHIRSSAGAWTHFQPDATTDLVTGTTTKVAWLKDRLFVVGTAGREIFEVVADSTPTAIKTLPEGWTFESIFEAGAFVYAPAVNADAGLSRVHILGLNNDATLIEDKGSVPIPRGELIYAGIGDPGGIFLGGGKANDDGGYDPVFYQAIQSETGFLQLLKITQGVGGNTDCSVLAFESLGDTIVFSWSQGSAALTGERAGIAMYHLGRQAFSQHLKKDAVSSAQVQDILFHEGRLILSIEMDGLYYEDTSTFVADAFLISSIADWGGASLKVWDRVEVSHSALPADTTVTVQYTTEDPSADEWFSTIISATDGNTGASSKLSNVVSRIFAVKLSSTANAGGTAAPLVQSFSIRSNLTRAQPEFTLTRFVRILAKDRKDKRGSVVYKDPVAERIAMMLLLDSWVTVWEPGIIWNAFIKSVSDTEPAEPFLSQTNGEPLKEAYLVRLDMVATGEVA